MSKRKNTKKRKKQKKYTVAMYCRVGNKEQLGELKDNASVK